MGPYIVLSQHRSGSSLVANVLQQLGVKMGDKFPRTNQYNPRGYWEDVDFIRMNVRLLKRAGGKWSNPPTEDRILAAGQFYETQITELLTRKMERSRSVKGGRWGWKDPRTCLTILIYHRILTETLHANPSYIVVQRNQQAVINSLIRRHRGTRASKWIPMVDAYQAALDNFLASTDAPRHFVNFDDLASKRKANSEITKLGWFIGRDRFRQQRDRAMKEIIFR